MGPGLRALHEPEDILQEACLAGLGALGRLPRCGRAALRTWLLRIARNRILDLARSMRRRGRPRRATPLPPSHLQLDLDERIPAAATTTREAIEELCKLRDSMGQLAFEQRTAVVLREYLELPWHTIALVLHRSTSAARKVHERARLRLRRAARDHEQARRVNPRQPPARCKNVGQVDHVGRRGTKRHGIEERS